LIRKLAPRCAERTFEDSPKMTGSEFWEAKVCSLDARLFSFHVSFGATMAKVVRTESRLVTLFPLSRGAFNFDFGPSVALIGSRPSACPTNRVSSNCRLNFKKATKWITAGLLSPLWFFAQIDGFRSRVN